MVRRMEESCVGEVGGCFLGVFLNAALEICLMKWSSFFGFNGFYCMLEIPPRAAVGEQDWDGYGDGELCFRVSYQLRCRYANAIIGQGLIVTMLWSCFPRLRAFLYKSAYMGNIINGITNTHVHFQ